MKVCARRFNTYLVLVAVLVCFCSCNTAKKKPKDLSLLRIHLEAGSSEAGMTDNVSVLRTHPLSVTITHNPVLTEANVVLASIIDSPGGFSVDIKFDESGALMLEQYTAANPGRHLVIFGQWGEKIADGRWLAAPLITHRISNGQIAFTPDMSRSEADRFVLGLNNVVAKNQNSLIK